MKLALGTVQFGIDYGVSNSSGKTPPQEVKCILDTCMREGVSFIDTAAQYGASEEVLGRLLGGRAFNVITKTPSLTVLKVSGLVKTFHQSLCKLQREHLYGLMFHDADVLLSPFGQEFYQQAVDLKRKGLVEKIGVSVYNGKQIESILQGFDIDIIQLPLNVFDQRLLVGGHLQDLKGRDVEIHVRSVFLQGLLLMASNVIPPYFSRIYSHFTLWNEELRRKNVSPAAASLGFVKNIPEVDKIVVGVNDNQQLLSLLENYNVDCDLDYSSFSLDDERYIDPRLWQL